jgi:outer membrane receptor protein involved in Fe transport
MKRLFLGFECLIICARVRPVLRFFCLLGAAFLIVSTPALAQFAQVNGTVRDQDGAVLPTVTIQVQNQETGFLRESTTNSTGLYVIGQIPPGKYKITASAPGFQSISHDAVSLAITQSATFDFTLKPGSIIETITVSAAVTSLNTSTSDIGATLQTDAVNELPLAGRNYTSLLTLQTGVTPINNDQTGGRTQAVGNAVYPSIQGQNNRSNIFLLDGVNNNEAISGSQTITPMPDDIEQMKILTHTDSAQFGQGLGGTINVITKSGTNQFHGGAWEYWRSSRFLDAKSVPTGRLDDLHQNQFGANFGGPVWLPFYNGKNRTFFYVSYEGFRQTIGRSALQLVPTAAEYTGDFSALLAKGIQLYDPFSPTRAPFTNNQIPSNLIDPAMVTLAQTLFPSPTGTYLGGLSNYLNTTPYTHKSDQYDLRGDEYLTKQDLVWVHYLHQSNPVIQYAGLPGLAGNSLYYGHNFGMQWTHTFGPSSVLTVGFGQNKGEIDPQTRYSGDVQSIVSAAGFDPNFACNYRFGLRKGCQLPNLSIGSYIGGGEDNGAPNVNSAVWEYKADYLQTLGRHTLYFGFNVDTNNQGKATASGSTATFSPFQTSNGSTGGNEFASFLLSLPSGASRQDRQNLQSGGYVNGVYGQDQWKLRDNLTLNFGLRYDVSIIPIVRSATLGPYYDIYDFDHGLDIIQNLPPPCSATQFAPCIPGGTLPAHVVVSTRHGKLFSSDWTNFQPRFGISYGFRKSSVLHLSYGRVYDNWAAVEQSAQNVSGWLVQALTQVANLNSQPGITNPVTAENPLIGFTGNYPPPTPFGSLSWNTRPQFRNPYSDQWTLGIQQAVGSSGVWNINYVGSAGRNIDYAPVANTARTPGPGPVAPRTPFPYMGQSFYDQPIGHLDYHALQTSFQGRTRVAGLTYLLSYTWSKGINFGTDGWYGIGTTSIENPYNPKGDRSVTGYDLPHVFTAGWNWAVPVRKRGFSTGSRIADYIVGNWQLNGILTLESGRPFTVFDAGDIANTGNFNFFGGYERPNQVGNPKLSHPTPQQWFNTAAFVAPAQYTFGNTGRNSLRSDPYKNLDLSLVREFPMYESLRFQLRLDTFNAFNHPVWGVPNACQNCANFGVVTSTINQPRIVQLAGKLVF